MARQLAPQDHDHQNRAEGLNCHFMMLLEMSECCRHCPSCKDSPLRPLLRGCTKSVPLNKMGPDLAMTSHLRNFGGQSCTGIACPSMKFQKLGAPLRRHMHFRSF
jgi:hypothetical protein